MAGHFTWRVTGSRITGAVPEEVRAGQSRPPDLAYIGQMRSCGQFRHAASSLFTASVTLEIRPAASTAVIQVSSRSPCRPVRILANDPALAGRRAPGRDGQDAAAREHRRPLHMQRGLPRGHHPGAARARARHAVADAFAYACHAGAKVTDHAEHARIRWRNRSARFGRRWSL